MPATAFTEGMTHDTGNYADLKARESELWDDGRRAYVNGQPRDTPLMDATEDAIAAFKGGWDEAKRELDLPGR